MNVNKGNVDRRDCTRAPKDCTGKSESAQSESALDSADSWPNSVLQDSFGVGAGALGYLNPFTEVGEVCLQKNSFPGLGISLPIFVLCWAGWSAWAQPTVLPQAVVNAHMVYIQNETGFVGLEYATILELNKWGHFELAERREKADLVLRLDSGTRVRLVSEREGIPAVSSALAEDSVPPGYARVSLLEPTSGQILWSGKRKTEGGKIKNGHLLDELREAFRAYERGKR